MPCRASPLGVQKGDRWRRNRSIGQAVKHSPAREQEQKPLDNSDDEVIGRSFHFPAKSRPCPVHVRDRKGLAGQEAKQAVRSQAGSAHQLSSVQHQAQLHIVANGRSLPDADAGSASLSSVVRKRQKLGSGRASSSQRGSHSSRSSATLPVSLSFTSAALQFQYANTYDKVLW